MSTYNQINKAIEEFTIRKARERLYTYDEVMEIVALFLKGREPKESKPAGEDLSLPPREGTRRHLILKALASSGTTTTVSLSRKTGLGLSSVSPRVSELVKGAFAYRNSEGKVHISPLGLRVVHATSSGEDATKALRDRRYAEDEEEGGI